MEDKAVIKKQSILDAAAKLFAQNGFYGTEVEQIAKTAGMAKGTVYNYFANKEEILISVIEYGVDQLEQIMKKGLSTNISSIKKIKRGIKLYINHLEKNMHLFKIMATEHIQFKCEVKMQHHTRVFSRINRLEKVIGEAVKNGEIRKVNPYIAATALTGMIDFLVFRELFDGKKFSTDYKVKQITKLFFEGILL